ncbi:flagellar hook-length control protein FliK [Ectopseudomonas khazarica]|uniref:flagellar hook-length control protein FliK n=1 Tax=Ectopseudomonas khazarica TaxID=2502979 RepID=UPI001AF00568|nr:flagellar hook-length control protein FliK [Pseudomonas khazarica]QTS86728.1 flagellar hook-length control protein FliK [Pseudomonas khazarica]
MLQLINANARVDLGGAAAEPALNGFAQAQSASGEQPAFDLQMELHAFAASESVAPPASAPAPIALGLGEADADAEQWLASVLGQQAVRVEARETAETAQHAPARPDEQEQDPQLAALPVDPARVPREPLPSEPERAAAPVAARPVPAQAMTAPMPPMALDAALQNAASLTANDSLEASLAERLPGTGSADDKASATATAPASLPANLAPTTERHLKLHAPQAQWGEQMLGSLREQVDVQINQRIQNATIRLDPPELGSLEIFLSHESGRLSVQLSAANADVARLLQQTSERLRQELVGQHFVQVDVQVSADAQGGRQQGQPRQAWLAEEPVHAASTTTADSGPRNPDSTSDVLVTV